MLFRVGISVLSLRYVVMGTPFDLFQGQSMFSIDIAQNNYKCVCAPCINSQDLQNVNCLAESDDDLCRCFTENCLCQLTQKLRKRGYLDCFKRPKQDAVIESKNLDPSDFIDQYGHRFSDLTIPLEDNPLLKVPDEKLNEVIKKLMEVDPSVDSAGFKSNPLWKKRVWTAVAQLREWIGSRDGEVSIKEILDIIGPWRNFAKEEAILNGDEPNARESFGTYTPNGYIVGTKITPPYDVLMVRDGYSVKDFMKVILDQDFEAMKKALIDITPPPEKTDIQANPDFQVQTQLDDETAGYIKVVATPSIDGVPSSGLVLTAYRFDLRSGMVSWDVQNNFLEEDWRNMMSRVQNDIIEAAKTKSVSDEDFHKMVATMHWMISNTSPFNRGSAAAADVLTLTSYSLRDLHWQGWAKDISADVSALCTPNLVEYQNGFLGLQKKPPVQL